MSPLFSAPGHRAPQPFLKVHTAGKAKLPVEPARIRDKNIAGLILIFEGEQRQRVRGAGKRGKHRAHGARHAGGDIDRAAEFAFQKQ